MTTTTTSRSLGEAAVVGIEAKYLEAASAIDGSTREVAAREMSFLVGYLEAANRAETGDELSQTADADELAGRAAFALDREELAIFEAAS